MCIFFHNSLYMHIVDQAVVLSKYTFFPSHSRGYHQLLGQSFMFPLLPFSTCLVLYTVKEMKRDYRTVM